MSDTLRHDRLLELVATVSASRRVPSRGSRLDGCGIDSLAFAELALAVEDELGVDLSALDVGPDTTVGDLTDAIDSAPRARPRRGLPRGLGRLQRTSELLGGGALRWWFDLRVIGSENVPPAGPVVLAMNHESALDIPIAVIASPRPITFMAKKELFKGPLVSRTLRSLGGFLVDRDRYDVTAVDTALAALERGDVLGMYPEGTRSPGTLLPFLHGAAWVALRTGAPLVPAAISGTGLAGRAGRPGLVRVRVVFAPPIAARRIDDRTERRRVAEDLTRSLREAIARDLVPAGDLGGTGGSGHGP